MRALFAFVASYARGLFEEYFVKFHVCNVNVMLTSICCYLYNVVIKCILRLVIQVNIILTAYLVKPLINNWKKKNMILKPPIICVKFF